MSFYAEHSDRLRHQSQTTRQQVAKGLATIQQMQDRQLALAQTSPPPTPVPTCYRCRRNATTSRNALTMCGYCATTTRPLKIVSVQHPPQAEHAPPPQPVKQRKHITRRMRRRRLAAVLIPTTILAIGLLGVAYLVVFHHGWEFFVLRAPGVGGSPG